MAELKTKLNDASVAAFLDSITDENKRADCTSIVTLMKRITKKEPKMWGTSIIGFDSYHYKGASGREGEWFIVGLSPRKQNITIYIISGFDRFGSLMKKLGKYKTGKGCLYINSLADIDKSVLSKLITESVKLMKTRYGNKADK